MTDNREEEKEKDTDDQDQGGEVDEKTEANAEADSDVTVEDVSDSLAGELEAIDGEDYDDSVEDSDNASEDDDEDSEEDSEEEVSTDAPNDQYDNLLAQINDLKGKLAEKDNLTTADPSEESDINYFSDIDMEALGTNPQILNALLNKVRKESIKNTMSKMLKDLPNLIKSQVSDHLTAREVSDQFYQENKDLSGVRNVVKAHANQVVQDHKDWNIEQVLKEAAVQTRTYLGMQVPKIQEVSSLDKAAFSKGSSGSRKNNPQVSALQQELDAL